MIDFLSKLKNVFAIAIKSSFNQCNKNNISIDHEISCVFEYHCTLEIDIIFLAYCIIGLYACVYRSHTKSMSLRGSSIVYPRYVYEHQP